MRKVRALGLVLALVVALTGAASAAERVYNVGIYEDPTTLNIFAQLGPDATVWNYVVVLSPFYQSLFGLAPPRWDFVPSVAADYPTPLKEEVVGGKTYWTSEVQIRGGVRWHDGSLLTADDVVWTYNTVLQLDPIKLGGNWPNNFRPEYLERVEKRGDYRVKFYLKKKPGIAVWQYGILQAPILQRKLWEPIVRDALTKEDPIRALFAAEVKPESASSWVFARWEKGAFFENKANPYTSFKGEQTVLYPNGAVAIRNPKTGYNWQTKEPAPSGQPQYQYETGPFFDAVIYRIYQNQNAALLALLNGEVDFVINPSGWQKGFQEQLSRNPNLATLTNSPNGFRYVAFNLRREPFNIKEFRQAVATLIDREFVTNTVLQGVANPMASMVPPGNAFWHNPEVKVWGKGMNRAQRIAAAVELLKKAGFKWQVEPKVDLQKGTYEPGEGLILPNGQPMKPFDLLAPAPGYDPLRATFALWIERWMRDIGIPVRARLSDFNFISTKAFDEQDFDMYMLGWGLTIFPDYLRDFFHSSNAGPGGFNSPGYNNPEFDKLADELLAATDLEEARKIAFRLQEWLAEDVPYIVLFDTPLLEAYRKDHVAYPFTKVLDGIQGLYGATHYVRPVNVQQ